MTQDCTVADETTKALFHQAFTDRLWPNVVQNIAYVARGLQKMVNSFAQINHDYVELLPKCKYDMRKIDCTFRWSKHMGYVKVGHVGEFIMP